MKMMKMIVPIFILGTQVVFGQFAAKKGVDKDQLHKHINELFQNNNDQANRELLKEANFLAKSKQEEELLLGQRIYSNLGMADRADAVNVAIIRKFPKGLTARNEAFTRFYEQSGLSAAELEHSYREFVKMYPEKVYNEKNSNVYVYGMSKVAQAYAKEKNLDKVAYYNNVLKLRKNYLGNLFAIVRELNKQHQYRFAIDLLAPAYDDLVKRKADKSDENADLSMLVPISIQYAEALSSNNELDKALQVLSPLQQESPSDATKLAYAKLLQAKGNDLDAFRMFEEQAIARGKTSEIMQQLLPLYSKLNNNLSDTSSYLRELDLRIKEGTLTKLRSEMVKNEAPQFSLLDGEGKEISLSSLKGKVVVLDFWATWCVPCKMSFPGMQATINKYVDDKDVVFLFIDTWQREANYKELVKNFIETNKYTFHVLFDEMKNTKEAVVSAYGVEGIPTKIIIDREGFIRFRSTGGGSNVDNIVNEMSAKIELARKG